MLGARKPTQGPQGAPRSCKSVFLKTLAPQPTSTCLPQAPGLGFECLLSPDLLCSHEVTCSLPLPRLSTSTPNSLDSLHPRPWGPGPLPGLGLAPCPPGRPLHRQPRWLFSSAFRLLADLTPCALTGNPQSETPPASLGPLCSGVFVKLSISVAPPSSTVVPGLAKTLRAGRRRAGARGVGHGAPWGTLPTDPHGHSWAGHTESVSVSDPHGAEGGLHWVPSLLEMRADSSCLASTRTGAVFSAGERPVGAVGGGRAWAVAGPLGGWPWGSVRGSLWPWL